MRIVGVKFGAILQALLECALFRKQQAIRGAQIVDLLAREPTALQADDIEATEMAWLPMAEPNGMRSVVISADAPTKE
jgi:hypothetical protein